MTISNYVRTVDDVLPGIDAATAATMRVGEAYVVIDGRPIAINERFAHEVIERALHAAAAAKVAHLEVDEELVTPERAAELLDVTRPTIYAWQNRNLLGRVNQGNSRMVPLEDVLERKRKQQARPALQRELHAAQERDNLPTLGEVGIDLTRPASQERPKRRREQGAQPSKA